MAKYRCELCDLTFKSKQPIPDSERKLCKKHRKAESENEAERIGEEPRLHKVGTKWTNAKLPGGY